MLALHLLQSSLVQMIRKWPARTQQTGPVGATPERSAYCPYVPALLARGTGRR